LRVVGPVFHVGIVLTLFRAQWNAAVWPWNLALAAAAILLFRSPAPVADHDRRPADRRSPVVLGAAALFFIYPLGFYVGHSDAYLSHNLYSSNTAEASLCTPQPASRCSLAPFPTWDRLHVPLPPERRLFIAFFEKICQPGQSLKIDGVCPVASSGAVAITSGPPALRRLLHALRPTWAGLNDRLRAAAKGARAWS